MTVGFSDTFANPRRCHCNRRLLWYISYLGQDGLDAHPAVPSSGVGDVLRGLLPRLRLAEVAAEEQQAEDLQARIRLHCSFRLSKFLQKRLCGRVHATFSRDMSFMAWSRAVSIPIPKELQF